MDSDVATAIVTAASTLLAGGIALFANDRIDRRRRSEARELRNLEERKRIAEDILAADQSLTEYHNDISKQIKNQTIKDVRPQDLDEALELWRVMNRAHKRARIYFSQPTVDLIVKRLRYREELNQALELPAAERPVAKFRARFSPSRRGDADEMEAALRREVGVVGP
jgi:hypothetical protein